MELNRPLEQRDRPYSIFSGHDGKCGGNASAHGDANNDGGNGGIFCSVPAPRGNRSGFEDQVLSEFEAGAAPALPATRNVKQPAIAKALRWLVRLLL